MCVKYLYHIRCCYGPKNLRDRSSLLMGVVNDRDSETSRDTPQLSSISFVVIPSKPGHIQASPGLELFLPHGRIEAALVEQGIVEQGVVSCCSCKEVIKESMDMNCIRYCGIISE